jgi:hypothetical protein
MVQTFIYIEHKGDANKPLYGLYISDIAFHRKTIPQCVIVFTLDENIIKPQVYSTRPGDVSRARQIIEAGTRGADLSTTAGWPEYLGKIDVRYGILKKLISDAIATERSKHRTAINLEKIIISSKIEELKGIKAD